MPQQQGNVFIGHVKTPGEAQDQALEAQARQFTLQAAVEERQAQIAKARQDRAQQEFLTQAAQQFTHDDGSPDFDRIIAESYKQFPDLGAKLEEHVGKMRKQAVDARKVELDNEKNEHDADLATLAQMTTPDTFAIFRPKIKDPHLAQALGDQFNPDLIAQIGQAGLSESERLARLKANASLYAENPHLAFLQEIAEAHDDDGIADAIAGARLMLPAEAVQSYAQRLGLGQPGVQDRAKALLAQSQKPASAPNVGSLEDYILRKYGPNPTPKQIEEARKTYLQSDDRPLASGSGGSGQSDDVKLVAHAIVNGQQPPEMTGMYRNTLALKAELARQGYDLTKATEDWKATQKYLNTLNGAQQTRLRQAVNFTAESLDVIDELNAKWKGGRFPLLNKAQLSAAKGGLLGKDAQSIATQLDAQISDLVSELGTVYKGGNSSTDESLKLAAENLKSNWSQKQLEDAINLVRRNLTIRRNSIMNTGAVAGKDNPYAPQMDKPADTGGWVFDPKTGKLVKKGGGG